MSKKQKFGLVVDTSFIGGGLKYPGEHFPYDGPYGEGIKECDADGKLLNGEEAPYVAPQGAPGGVANQYKAKHNGGGRYIILDANGEKFSDFTGNKDEALAEEERLNKGGAPYVAPQEGDEEQDSRNLPDA